MSVPSPSGLRGGVAGGLIDSCVHGSSLAPKSGDAALTKASTSSPSPGSSAPSVSDASSSFSVAFVAVPKPRSIASRAARFTCAAARRCFTRAQIVVQHCGGGCRLVAAPLRRRPRSARDETLRSGLSTVPYRFARLVSNRPTNNRIAKEELTKTEASQTMDQSPPAAVERRARGRRGRRRDPSGRLVSLHAAS